MNIPFHQNIQVIFPHIPYWGTNNLHCTRIGFPSNKHYMILGWNWIITEFFSFLNGSISQVPYIQISMNIEPQTCITGWWYTYPSEKYQFVCSSSKFSSELQMLPITMFAASKDTYARRVLYEHVSNAVKPCIDRTSKLRLDEFLASVKASIGESTWGLYCRVCVQLWPFESSSYILRTLDPGGPP